MIADAVRLIEQAAALGRPGPYQIQAALLACHAEASAWQETDWPQILALDLAGERDTYTQQLAIYEEIG